MGRMGDNWARSYLNSRGVFAAITVGLVLIYALILKQQDDARLLIQTRSVTATVVEIKIVESDSRYVGKNITYITHLTLAEGKKIRFMLLQPPPKVGAQVPVIIDIYDDGTEYYHYNIIDWQLHSTR